MLKICSEKPSLTLQPFFPLNYLLIHIICYNLTHHSIIRAPQLYNFAMQTHIFDPVLAMNIPSLAPVADSRPIFEQGTVVSVAGPVGRHSFPVAFLHWKAERFSASQV